MTRWVNHGWWTLVLLGCGCAMHQRIPALPDSANVVREQLIIHSNFDLPRRHRLLDELTAQRVDLSALLNLPMSDEPIHVYLFESMPSYQAYIREFHPHFPDRRAFFVESDTKLSLVARASRNGGDSIANEWCTPVGRLGPVAYRVSHARCAARPGGCPAVIVHQNMGKCLG